MTRARLLNLLSGVASVWMIGVGAFAGLDATSRPAAWFGVSLIVWGGIYLWFAIEFEIQGKGRP